MAELLDGFGFDVVDVGPLAESWRIQPGTPGYCSTVELRRADCRPSRCPAENSRVVRVSSGYSTVRV